MNLQMEFVIIYTGGTQPRYLSKGRGTHGHPKLTTIKEEAKTFFSAIHAKRSAGRVFSKQETIITLK